MCKARLFKPLIVVLTATVLGVAPYKAALAADPSNDDLKAQVKSLNERIAQLEKQLDQKNQPMASSTRASVHDEWDPFQEMQNMQAQMNQMFQNSFDRGLAPGTAGMAGPKTDIKETPTQYILTMDLPGMDKSKINVEVKNGMLVISGERSEENQVSQGNQFRRQERSFGHFMRVMPLPDDAKADDVKANYQNGVLEVKVGRVAQGKPGTNGGKRIEVN